MNIIREPIAQFTISSSLEAVFEKVNTALARTKFKILTTNISEGTITVSCIVDLLNVGVWRSWADKIILYFKQNDKNQTEIQIYGIPNFLRIKTDKTDRIYSKAEIETELRKIIQNETSS